MRRHTVIVLAVIILGAGAFLLLRQPAASEPEKTADSAKSAAAPKAAPSAAPQVAAPIVAPAPKPVETAAPAATMPADPHTDLNATIGDIAGRLQSGNLYDIFMDYGPPQMISSLTPEAKAAMHQQIQEAEANPDSQPLVQMMVQGLLSMQGTPPSLNDTGTRATYSIPMPGNAASTLNFTFNNVDGKWYIANFPVTMNQVNGAWRLQSNLSAVPSQ